MKSIKILFLTTFIGLAFCPGLLPALTPGTMPEDTLLVTVVNHSDHILTYRGASHTNGNLFTLTSRDILPGASITIRATSTRWAGVAGDLTFEDAKGRKNILQIRDPLQISRNRHPEKFAMNNPRFVSFIPSRTLNSECQPHNLTYTHATVEIQNRLERA